MRFLFTTEHGVRHSRGWNLVRWLPIGLQGEQISTAPTYDLRGKVITITGGSRGLGHAMAIAFARAGAKVAIASRKLEACESTVQEIRALGAEGSAHGVHVGLWRDCERLADEVYTRWGRCDGLIHNAAMPQ